jgi:hypothetical protein
MTDELKYFPLSLPGVASRKERQAFRRLCQLMAAADLDTRESFDHQDWLFAAGLDALFDQPILAAAVHTTIDLIEQGWSVKVDRVGALFSPPPAHRDRAEEKARIQRQELLRRNEQLLQPSVRRFVEGMEQRRPWRSAMVSVFDLMRDGRELADSLEREQEISDVITPYVQIVDDSICELTGLKLHDIWRYFRHTWSNAYSTVPGRSMPLLVRDAATPHHAVIGLAAISSPVVQIAERDSWIGWDTEAFLDSLEAKPTAKLARWVARRVKEQPQELHVADLLRDGVIGPDDLELPNAEAIARLRADAERHRARHHRASRLREARAVGENAWVARAETDLFRGKRAAALADALEIAQVLGPYLEPRPTASGLQLALADPQARRQLRRVVRRARGERVGTVIADLTVCGAVAPYNALAAGKLVGALSVSPTVVTAYREKYSRPSEIASAMAGRPIRREARLAFIGTTSLYGTGSSQYNRLNWPASVMGGAESDRMAFQVLGRSRSYGTSHLSSQSVAALLRLSSLQGSLTRVNSLFGEGVSPRMRKVRLGFGALGWPANDLLKHGRERILYGVALVSNLRDYALGIDVRPKYLLDTDAAGSDASVAAWWFQRWARNRSMQESVLKAIREHTLMRPVRHGARVPLPPQDLFSSQDHGDSTHRGLSIAE